MKAQIILRAKTSSTSNFLNLSPVARLHRYTRPDRGPVCLGSDQLYQQPGVCWRRLIAQKGRIIIQIIEYDIDSTGVKNIAKGSAATASRLRKSRTGLVGNIYKSAAVDIAHQNQLAVSFRELV